MNKNKSHVMVSGGSKGLGLSICEDLLKQGYRISTFSRTKTDAVLRLIDSYPNDFYYASIDLKQAEELKTFVDDASFALGTPYGLINNAAIVQDGILMTLPEIEIQKMIDINLTGSLFLTRLFLRKILKPMQGRIINISSIIASRGYKGLSVYAATKAGLDAMTRSLSRELGKNKITVNSIAPGYLKTDLSSKLTYEQLAKICKRTPLGRLATVEDITPLVQFLLSEQASFITGQTIFVDGGISN